MDHTQTEKQMDTLTLSLVYQCVFVRAFILRLDLSTTQRPLPGISLLMKSDDIHHLSLLNQITSIACLHLEVYKRPVGCFLLALRKVQKAQNVFTLPD